MPMKNEPLVLVHTHVIENLGIRMLRAYGAEILKERRRCGAAKHARTGKYSVATWQEGSRIGKPLVALSHVLRDRRTFGEEERGAGEDGGQKRKEAGCIRDAFVYIPSPGCWLRHRPFPDGRQQPNGSRLSCGALKKK